MSEKRFFRKMPGGVLVPDDESTAEWMQKVKNGDVLGAEFRRPRNYRFLQKLMCLYRCCFDYFVEQQDWNMQYRGMQVEPSFEMFRKQLTILAGHYVASYDIRGDVRLEAKSLSFANCTEEEAEQIFSDVINAALKQVYRFSMTEDQLRKLVDDILSYA